MRTYIIERNTLETKIKIELNLDGNGKSDIDTGIGFLDHMLTLFAFHSKFDLKIKCDGDLYVDDHHTIEDLGICLGEVFKQALGDKKGIRRYSTICIPMDESLAFCSVDISNRPYLVFNVCRVTLHINLIYGENDHHKIEAIFKAFARVLKEGSEIIGEEVSSSKGVL